MAVVSGTGVQLQGLSILVGSGPPSASLGAVGQPGYLDTTNNLLYSAKTASGWPATGNQFGGNFVFYAGAPPSSVGLNGNLSFDTNQGFIYGPKANGAWPTQPFLSLVGPQGVQGPTGPAAVYPNEVTGNSVVVAPVSGDSNVVQIALKNASGTTLFVCDASGNTTVSGTLKVTGATTLAGASVTSLANTGNETVAGTLAVTGAASAKSLTLTSGGGGGVTYADGTTQTMATVAAAASATGSRTMIDLGGNASAAQPANSAWTYELAQYGEQGSGSSTAPIVLPVFVKFPFPCTLTGWALYQYQASGTQIFQVNKNRTTSSLNTLVQVTAGTATVASFPGNVFAGTFTKGTYNFAAGDVVTATGTCSTAGANNARLYIFVEWTG